MWHFSITFYDRLTEKEEVRSFDVNQYSHNYLEAWSEAVGYAKMILKNLCNENQSFDWIIKTISNITR